MTAFLLNSAIIVCTIIAMEVIAWVVHRHVMHGFGWGWHASHHALREGVFEKNDLYAIFFAAIAIVLIWLGTHGHAPLQWVGAGMTAYGALYFVAHDGLVHQRWPLKVTPRGGYLKRLYQAHHLHHAAHDRLGAVSFGFLWAPSPKRLRLQLQEMRRRGEPSIADR